MSKIIKIKINNLLKYRIFIYFVVKLIKRGVYYVITI